jgi:cytochrome c biogenesis protein CcmG, thiol:disulfide interchange protein DsbE
MSHTNCSSRRAFLRKVACAGIAGLSASVSPAERANELRLGQAAPPATLVTLEDEHISTVDLKGRVVLLTFWATWCGPCRQELPLLSAYAQEHAADGLTVLGFTLDDPEDLEKVRAVQQRLAFPVGFVAASTLPGYGRIWRIPVNFAIDRRGRLLDDGWKDKQATWTAERLDRIITPLLTR